LLFLYREVLKTDLGPIDALRAKKPKRLPTVLTTEEVHRVLGELSGTHQLTAKLLYGSGLRLQVKPVLSLLKETSTLPNGSSSSATAKGRRTPYWKLTMIFAPSRNSSVTRPVLSPSKEREDDSDYYSRPQSRWFGRSQPTGSVIKAVLGLVFPSLAGDQSLFVSDTEGPSRLLSVYDLCRNPPRQFSHPPGQPEQRPLMKPRQRGVDVVVKPRQPTLFQIPRSKVGAQDRARRGAE